MSNNKNRDFELEAFLYDWLHNASEEHVADQLSEALNAARNRIETEKEELRKAEEAKRVEEENRECRIVMMCGLIGDYQDFLKRFYPSLGEELSEEENRDLAVSMVDMLDRMSEVGNNLKVSLKFTEGASDVKERREFERLFNLLSPYNGKWLR